MYYGIDICQDFAERFREPSALDKISEESRYEENYPPLNGTSLSHGLPGFVCFFSAMAHRFPNQGWDDAAHDYLKTALSRTKDHWYSNSSLFYGTCGLCYATYLCAKHETRYQKLLTKLESLLVKEIESFLAQIKNNTKDISLYHCNLIYGLGGVIAYLLMRKNQWFLNKLAKECLVALVHLLKTPKNLDGNSVPGWYVSPENQFMEITKQTCPNGSFNLSMAEGLAGCLSVLSLAAWEGFASPDLVNTINTVASWLQKKTILKDSSICWPHTIPLELESQDIQARNNLPFDSSWYQGSFSIAISLYLAGRAMNDKGLKTLAEESFISLISLPEQQPNNIDVSMAWGKAGLLMMTYRMSKWTNNLFLYKQVLKLQNEIQNSYNPNNPLGFQKIYVDSSGKGHQLNDAGLLEGSVGIALSLLSVSGGIEDIMWDRAFLLT
jgi:hypothetical protein